MKVNNLQIKVNLHKFKPTEIIFTKKCNNLKEICTAQNVMNEIKCKWKTLDPHNLSEQHSRIWVLTTRKIPIAVVNN